MFQMDKLIFKKKKVPLKARAPKLNKQKEIPILTGMKKLTKAFKILK